MGIRQARAEEIAELFVGAGIARSAIELSWHDDPEVPMAPMTGAAG